MAHLLQYPAVDVRTEGMEVDRPLPDTWLEKVLEGTDVEPRTEEAATLRGRLSRSGNDIVVRGRVHAEVALPCARCLDPAPFDVDADLSLLLQPAHRSELRRSNAGKGGQGGKGGDDEEYEFSAAEADLDVYDGETVVLDSFVREAILLEIPNFPLCREDCPGLLDQAPDREEVAAIDPRLAPLSAFRKKGEGPVSVEDLVAAAADRSQAMGRKPVLKTNQRSPGKKKKK